MALELYVSPSGSDTNPGTRARPFATLRRAQKAARKRQNQEAVTVVLRAGVYYLSEPLIFTAEDSGTRAAPLVYRAYPNEKPVLSGGLPLRLAWKPYRNGIFQAVVPPGVVTDQLFVNGEKQPIARYPDFDPKIRPYGGYAPDIISPERVARWADPTGGYLHIMHSARWGDFTYEITGKKASDNTLASVGGWQNNRGAPWHPQFRYVENIFEELDAPREWYLNRRTNTLYYYPPAGLDLAKATVEGVRLKRLIAFQGSEQKPVRFLSLQGLTFRHAARTFMENKEPVLRTDWTIYRGGAVVFQGAEDCALENCHLEGLGGNAVFVDGYNRRISVRGCHLHDIGANGVAFVGDPKAVRSPLFGYSSRQKYEEIDRTPGPRTNDYPTDCRVEDCLIHNTGQVELQTAPVEIDMARNITVRHCSIYDVPRAGINIGDGCWGGHVIEFCDVFDTVQETGDHGSFNSWGRDRFWGLTDVDLNTINAKAENGRSELPLLDAVQPNILRNNRWRCDHGWDIDLDDGSSNYLITNNLCLNGGIKNREGFYRSVENNITVNNAFHPHAWYVGSGDRVRHNIVWEPYRPAGRMPSPPWGGEMDYNFVQHEGPEGVATLQRQSGRDTHSAQGEARFVDAARGDYRVQQGSPALAIGFVNFPMNQFGVQKPELKAIARTPELPLPGGPFPTERLRDAHPLLWQGAQVRTIVSEGDMSAYGLPGVTGVLVVAVPTTGFLAKAGLQKDDVLLALNGQKIDQTTDLPSTLPAGQDVRLKILRAQAERTLLVHVP